MELIQPGPGKPGVVRFLRGAVSVSDAMDEGPSIGCAAEPWGALAGAPRDRDRIGGLSASALDAPGFRTVLRRDRSLFFTGALLEDTDDFGRSKRGTSSKSLGGL